jgi:predicted DCC family thiol-disulfide oxidoreductase YuxK
LGAEREKFAIVLFDGQCNLCNRSVKFIVRRDAHYRFRFASLQSESGRKIVEEHGKNPADRDTILLLQDGKLYDRSTAALRIARALTGPWPLLFAFIVVPVFVRDIVYRLIANNRYRWFGKTETCMIPTPDIRARFLTD